MKASAGPAHPGVARSRAVTGAHRAKSSGGIAEVTSEAEAATYYPSNPELAAMGISRDLWDASGAADRLGFARAAAGGGSGVHPADAEQAARVAALGSDEEAFQRALALVPVERRAAILEQHLRARGASDDAVRAGLFRLAEQGLSGLSSWLNSDLQRDLEQIRGRSQTEQARIREEQETARAEINAATERYRIDHASTAQPQPPAPGGNGMLFAAVGIAVVGAIALLVASQRKAG